MSDAITPRLLTTAQAAAYTGRPRTALYEAMARGELDSLKIGGSRRFTPAQLDAWVDQLIADAARTA